MCTLSSIEACLAQPCIKFCRIAGILYTFYRIESFSNLSLLPSLLFSKSSRTVISVGANFLQSLETALDIPSSVMDTVLGEILTILNRPNFRVSNLKHDLTANRSVTDFIMGGRSIYMCYWRITALSHGKPFYCDLLCNADASFLSICPRIVTLSLRCV